MVRTCCVPGCKSNYYESHVPTFVLPKNQSLREQWIQNIRRYNFEYTDKTAVCAKHFEPHFIIREDIFPIVDGEPIRIPRKIPRLSRDAIPTIFPDESVVSRRKKRIPKTCDESQLQEALQGQKENCIKVCKQNGSLDVSETERDTPDVPISKRKRNANLKLDRSGKPDKLIKIESVISLSNAARTLLAASKVNQKRKAVRARSSKKKSTVQQRRTSTRLSICGRRKWTNFYKVEYETNTQSKKIQNKLRRTCPKEVRVVVERIPRRSVRNTSEEGPSKERTSQRNVQSTLGKGPSKERISRRSVQSTSEKSPSKDRKPRRSVRSTSDEGPLKERTPQRNVQSTVEKGPSKERVSRRSVQSTSEKGPSKEKIPRQSLQSTSGKDPPKGRIPQPTTQSTLEESPSKETPTKQLESSNMTSKKRSRGSVGRRPRKILRLDDEIEDAQVSCGLENSQDDAAEGVKVSGNCVVCNNYVEQGTVLATLTNVSKEHFHEKLNRLATGQDAVTVKKDGVLCSVCTRLLNYMDRIEVELSMLKTALINCMRKKRLLKQDSHGSGQDQHETSDGNSKTDVPPPVNLDHTEEDRDQKDSKETLADGKEHVGYGGNHVDINSSEPLDEARCDSSEQPDPSSDAAINEENQTKTNDQEYKCKICLFKTCHKSVMIFHLRQHVEDKFRCDFCNINIPEDSEYIRHMLTLPPYLRQRKKVIRFPEDLKPERPISKTNTDLVVKQDLATGIENINSEALPHNVIKVYTSDYKTGNYCERNVKLLGIANIGTKISCDVKVQENRSVLKPKRTVVKKIICKTGTNLVMHDLKCHPPEAN
ncbi:uncharacterized protein [Anabrus simplex]|uniref:uncharacterized protein isoform X2 n=1 Tax=Anabrus simplex TaxID=316456 RepID=UPI0035A39B45